MSSFLYIVENEVQLVALLFLTTMYIYKLIWLFRFKTSHERTYPAGNAHKGIALSMMNIAMPWAMESTRKKPFFYFQFVLFHIGVTAAIATSFIIPYWSKLFENKSVTIVFQIILGLGLIAGLIRLIRRMVNPIMRLISTLDDYLSLVLVNLFLGTGVFAVPNNYQRSELPLIIFFLLTALLLIYVPFSKICHYLYYPFTRFFLGRTMGHRGVVAKTNKLLN